MIDVNKILEKFGLKPSELQIIQSRMRVLNLGAGELFCQTGKRCDRLGILIEGLLMANFDTLKGKLNVSRFFYHPNNIIVTSFESFKSMNSANESIVALEDSLLFYFTSDDMNFLYEKVAAMNKIARHFAEESYLAALRRIHDLQVLNSKERIEKLYKTQKSLFNRATKQHIASYLRVNRNDLTKVISKLRE